MKYIYYILFVIFLVACSYKVISIQRDSLNPLNNIKALYYMSANGLAIEVKTNDDFKSVTIKDNLNKEFYLTKKEYSKKFCFENSDNLELCLKDNMAILTKNSQNTTKLILVTVDK